MTPVRPSPITDPFDGRLERPSSYPDICISMPNEWRAYFAGVISRLDDPLLWGFADYGQDLIDYAEWYSYYIHPIFEALGNNGGLVKRVFADNCIVYAENCDGDIVEVLDVASCVQAQGVPLLAPTLPDGGGSVPSPDSGTINDPDRFNQVDVPDCDLDVICGASGKVIDYLKDRFQQLWSQVNSFAGSAAEFAQFVVPVGDVLASARIERWTSIANLVLGVTQIAIDEAFGTDGTEAATCALYCAVVNHNCAFSMAAYDQAREGFRGIDAVWGLISDLTSSFIETTDIVLGLGGIIPRRQLATRFRLGLDEANDDCATLCTDCPTGWNIRALAGSASGGTERSINDPYLRSVASTTVNTGQNTVEFQPYQNEMGNWVFDGVFAIGLPQYYRVSQMSVRIRYVGTANQGAQFDLSTNNSNYHSNGGAQNPREQFFNIPEGERDINWMRVHIYGGLNVFSPETLRVYVDLVTITGAGFAPEITTPPY